MEHKLEIIKCYKEAWQFFKARPGLAIGSMLLYIAIMYPGQILVYFNEAIYIQLFNVFMSLFVLPPMMIGLMALSLNLAGVGEPRVNDLFSGFRMYWKTIGLYFMYMLIIIGLSIPVGVIIVIVILVAGNNLALLITIGLIYVVILMIVTIRWMLIFFVLADEPEIGILECLSRSSQLTEGNRLRLLGVYAMMFLITLLGLLALGVGIFVSMPIGMIAVARAYLWLKSFHPPVGAVEQQQPAQ